MPRACQHPNGFQESIESKSNIKTDLEKIFITVLLIGFQSIFNPLRANATENQAKFKFSGRSRKTDFCLFSSAKSP